MGGLPVGRQAELEAAERFLGRIPEGPAALVFEGEAGIGKSTLWRHALVRGRELRCRVLSCSPAEPEVRLAFSSLTDLLAEVEEEALASLPAPQRRALDVALLRVDATGHAPDQRVVCTAVTSLFKALGESVLVVAVDDAQWLDRPSARVLEFAARRLQGRRVGFLLSVRRPSETPVPLGLDRAVPNEELQRVRIGPLSIGALHQVLKTELGEAVPRATLVRVHRATGGNPFFALEVARTLSHEGMSPAGNVLAVPADVRDLLRARMRRLPAATRQTLGLASAMADPTLDALQRAAKLSPRAMEKRLAQAEGAGIVLVEVDRVRFSHPLYASAVYEAMSVRERRSRHRQVAAVTSNTEQRARHLALAAASPDQEIARALDAAAHAARARGAPDAAAELGELAIRLTPPGRSDAVRRRATVAAEHHLRAGDLERAHVLLDEALRNASAGPERGEALLLLAQIRQRENRFPEVLELLAKALEQAGSERRLAASISLELAFVRIAARDFDAAEAPLRDAIAHGESLGLQPLLAEALAAKAMTDFLCGRGLDRGGVARALALEDPNRQVAVLVRPSMIAALLDLFGGELDSARARLGALRRRVIERGEESDLPLVAVYLALLECRSGDLAAAARYASEALESAEQLESESLRALALAFGALVAAHSGEAAAARSAASEALELSRRTGWQIVTESALGALGLLELSLGDAEAADRALGELAAAVEAVELTEPVQAMFLPEAIEASIGCGRFRQAERLVDMLEHCARRLDRPWALACAGRCRGLLRASEGDLDAALRSLEEALRQHERVPMPLERARTLLAYGVVLRRKGERRRAQTTLEQAHAIFEQHSAALWAQRARGELRQLGGRPTTKDELTPAEQRVAELAATGMTNRDVAAALFISPKTVEANLARVYRKLGIHSRAELGARAAAAAVTALGVM